MNGSCSFPDKIKENNEEKRRISDTKDTKDTKVKKRKEEKRKKNYEEREEGEEKRRKGVGCGNNLPLLPLLSLPFVYLCAFPLCPL
ncbi:hypothetical protein AGMMS4952_17510 [Spirochaetia bacterium]|nr:hypothetical protein AGMMS4952_17510 [Spirochaetia bacterium]